MQLSDRIGRRIKLQDVHILMAVVQAGSMGKAARQLNTSQPNISKSIADLEYVLGVQLLDRHSQGVEPTEYGRAVLDGGAAVFDELRQTVKNIEFLVDPTAGEVRVGCNSSVATSFITAVVDRLSRRYPRIVFHIVTAHVEQLYRELNARSVDLLIARRPVPVADESMECEILFADTYVVAAGVQSPWARRRKIDLAELVNESWVLSPRESVLGLVAMEAFRASGLEYPRTTVVTRPVEVRMSLLATGRFLSIFPSSVLRFPTTRTKLKVLPVTQAFTRGRVEIVTMRNRALSPVVQLFIDSAREVAKPLLRRNR
jgi:DNA-binding transcriptional LysR family regulator